MRSGIFFIAMFSAAFFGMLADASVYGQSRTNISGTGGIHEIRGRVYLPSGKSVDSPIRVELHSVNFGTLSVDCDRSGSYSFKGLAPGNYSVVLNGGDNYETVREYVTLDTEVQGLVRIPPTPKLVTVPIYLQAKRGVSQVTGVINAKWANVPKSAIENYETGLEFMKENKPAEATAAFTKSVEIAPSFAPAHAALGKIFLITGKLDEAVSSLRSAIRYDAEDFSSHLNCGVALLNKRELDEAYKEFNIAAGLDKLAVTPRYYIGLVYIQRQDLDNAVKELEAAKGLAGENGFPLVHKYLGGIYWQKGSAEQAAERKKDLFKLAADELERYVKLMPDAQDARRIKETVAELRSKHG